MAKLSSLRPLAVIAVSAIVSGVLSVPVGAQPAEVAVSGVEWGPCSAADLKDVPADQLKLYSCGALRVPIDHDNAELGTIDIAMMRRSATKPESRIGSIFINPGGPGGSGRRWAVAFAGRTKPEVAERFDTIGFDPRGVGLSNPLRCFTTNEDATEVNGRQKSVPRSATEISETLGSLRDYGRHCGRNAGALLNHMSTKDVVRDLDAMRAAVGDRKLTYVGFSYGTLIGATYANMFPNRVRALVLDGNVDPALRTSDGLRYDQERSMGFEIALKAYLDACAASDKCAFGQGDPHTKFVELRDHVVKSPIELTDGKKITISSLTDAVAGALYSQVRFAPLAVELDKAHKAVTGQDLAPLSMDDLPLLSNPPKANRDEVPLDEALISARTPYVGDDSYAAVNCSDKLYEQHDQSEIPAIAGRWERRSATFGRTHAFGDPALCSVWPVDEPDAYRGPWNRHTDVPIVVVGNLYDPATQYEFSRRMADQLSNARLVSVDMIGHCALGRSATLDEEIARYLLTQQPPEDNQTHKANIAPF